MRTPDDDQLPLFLDLDTACNTYPGEAGDAASPIDDAEALALNPAVLVSPAQSVTDGIHSLPIDPNALEAKVDALPPRRKSNHLGTASRPVGVPSLEQREDRLLTVKEVSARLRTSVPTVWRWSRERNDFPKPLKIGPKSTRWKLSDLLAFQQSLV